MDNDNIIKKMLSRTYKNIKFKIDYMDKTIYTEEDGNRLIYEMIRSNKPFAISRFGATELNCVRCYMENRKFDSVVKYRIKNHAGVFPDTEEVLNDFSKIYLKASSEVDVLGVWGINFEKRTINKYCKKDIKLIKPRAIEPYYFNNPWSKALEGKKVLVIHPFEDTIINQYEKRERLFSNSDILPKFGKLDTLKAVQSIAGDNDEFKDWIEAYEYMCNEISKKDFDVAIIGAGAYGLPLCSYIKKLNKQAIHMGGATQIFFGIQGKRWDKHSYISNLYNNFWVRPMKSETPKKASSVEGGSYW